MVVRRAKREALPEGRSSAGARSPRKSAAAITVRPDADRALQLDDRPTWERGARAVTLARAAGPTVTLVDVVIQRFSAQSLSGNIMLDCIAFAA
jgi:hypothetical protein